MRLSECMLDGIPEVAEKNEIFMPAEENKSVIISFVEEVVNEGRLERADDLVAVDFVEVDPLPGQQQGREGLK
jgi:predicted SnoaL-like aldol condensation-catalyzing enzyme